MNGERSVAVDFFTRVQKDVQQSQSGETELDQGLGPMQSDVPDSHQNQQRKVQQQQGCRFDLLQRHFDAVPGKGRNYKDPNGIEQ
ncbi:hypothetical protein D1872_258720 [compost metagenome]